jgi:alpha-mannosidase
MKKFLVLLVLMLPMRFLLAQEAGPLSASFFKGYQKSLTTGNFEYHSPEPDVNRSLLLRSVDSSFYIMWETETVPLSFSGSSARFVWMFGIDANPESHSYRIYINGHYLLTFANPVSSELKPWSISGPSGASIIFRTTMLDKYNDPMGYALLEVPGKFLEKGKPQVIRIVGESAGSRVWYMTFESEVSEKLTVTQEEALILREGKESYSLVLGIVRLGNAAKAEISLEKKFHQEVPLETGYNRIQAWMPVSPDMKPVAVEVKIDGKPAYTRSFTPHPVRKWTIYLVQHAHTDIGYTRPQTEILPEHLRYIDYALDFCDQTDSLPDAARFRWTCETSWAVREYLRSRPKAQVERLKKRIREKRIEVTGLFLNSSDLADEASIVTSLEPVKEMRAMGIPVRSAMQDDINGVPWCLPDYLKGADISYLNMGQNTHRAHKPFDRPTTFWWESPSGNRILVNRPEHYMWANQLGILTNMETFGKALFRHLNDIGEKGYPFDQYAIQFSGYLTDNSPPSTTACDIVKKWNETYLWPKLRLATIGEFLFWVEVNHPDEIPVVRGAWPDWWMDGFGSDAIPTAYTRATHAGFVANSGLMTMSSMLGNTPSKNMVNLRNSVADDLSFYDEHTFGAAESISDPLCENSVVQLGEKESYAWEAVKKNRILQEEIMGQVQPFLPRYSVPSVTVFNTLGWPRTGLAEVYIDHQVLPKDKKFRILDPDGKEIAAQPLGFREDGTYWALNVKEVPAMGFSSCRIIADTGNRLPDKEVQFRGVMENAFYRLTVDTAKGIITSLYDKETKTELVDPAAPFGFGAPVYERLGKNRHQLELLTLEEKTRVTWNELKISGITRGPVWQEVTITGQIAGCADPSGIICTLRLFNEEKKIELRYSMKKLPVTDPEGVYVSFPFALKDSKFLYEVAGGSVVPPWEQITGSSSDWVGIQDFVSLRNKNLQVTVVSPEVPLVMLGDINLGNFAMNNVPKTPHLYSWVMNNYWTTNFLGSQEGELKWNYRITSSADTSRTAAGHFGRDNRIPLLSRVFPAGKEGPLPGSFSFFGDVLKDLLLINSWPVPDGKGIILQLREMNGQEYTLHLSGFPMQAALPAFVKQLSNAKEVNVLGEKLGDIDEEVVFKPFETKFIQLGF